MRVQRILYFKKKNWISIKASVESAFLEVGLDTQNTQAHTENVENLTLLIDGMHTNIQYTIQCTENWL